MIQQLDALHRRLETLERQNRRMRRWGGTALVASLSLGGLGLAAAQEVPKVLKTEKLEVVDGNGTVRVSLGSTDGQAGAYIDVSNEKGETRFALATGPTLGSVLTMYGRGDGSLSPGVMMQARPGKQMPILAIVSPESAASAQLSFEAPDVPRFTLNDRSGKAVFKASGTPNPSLVLGSSNGEARVEMGFEASERPQITLRDRNDKVTFRAVK